MCQSRRTAAGLGEGLRDRSSTSSLIRCSPKAESESRVRPVNVKSGGRKRLEANRVADQVGPHARAGRDDDRVIHSGLDGREPVPRRPGESSSSTGINS